MYGTKQEEAGLSDASWGMKTALHPRLRAEKLWLQRPSHLYFAVLLLQDNDEAAGL